jgi:hypothetical protein
LTHGPLHCSFWQLVLAQVLLLLLLLLLLPLLPGCSAGAPAQVPTVT